MKWLSDNVDLMAVLLLALLLAAGPSKRNLGFEGFSANSDSFSDVMRIDQIGELIGNSVDQVLNCSANQGE